MQTGWAGPIVLYDGECAFCSRVVHLIVDRDPAGVYRFAALQSPLGQALLRRHGLRTDDFDTLLLVEGGEVWERSTAALRIAGGLRGPARRLAALLRLPGPLRDWAYDRVARRRHLLLGGPAACRLPTPELRARVLDG